VHTLLLHIQCQPAVDTAGRAWALLLLLLLQDLPTAWRTTALPTAGVTALRLVLAVALLALLAMGVTAWLAKALGGAAAPCWAAAGLAEVLLLLMGACREKQEVHGCGVGEGLADGNNLIGIWVPLEEACREKQLVFSEGLN
jgi:hypothetical protein